jgi:protein-S-isoprenylcysteine O-methyltransferase Ste14
MVVSPRVAIALIWAGWWASWLAAAAWSARTEKRSSIGSELPSRIIAVIGIVLLFRGGGSRAAMEPLWRLGTAGRWSMVLLTAAGFAFCWWARLHLGRLWSAAITRKQGHHVVDTGPYAWVRHPIYAGVILAAFATAIERGSAIALAGAAIMTIGWYLKARSEERFLRAELGAADYDAYARRVAMLVPLPRSRP